MIKRFLQRYELLRPRWLLAYGMAFYLLLHVLAIFSDTPNILWFTDNPKLTGTCEAITAMQIDRAWLSGSPTFLTANEALAHTRAALNERLPDVEIARLSRPVSMGMLNNDRMLFQWMIIAEFSGDARLPNAAIVMVWRDANIMPGTRIILAGAAVDPTTCPFNVWEILTSPSSQPSLRALLIELSVFILYVAANIGLSWRRQRMRTVGATV